MTLEIKDALIILIVSVFFIAIGWVLINQIGSEVKIPSAEYAKLWVAVTMQTIGIVRLCDLGLALRKKRKSGGPACGAQ